MFFPFFIGGYYCDMNIVKRIKPWMRVCGGVILVFVYVILLVKGNNFLQYLDIAYSDESYASIGVSTVEGMLVRSAWYVIAVIMTISFLVVVPDKKTTEQGGGSIIYSVTAADQALVLQAYNVVVADQTYAAGTPYLGAITLAKKALVSPTDDAIIAMLDNFTINDEGTGDGKERSSH